MFRVKKKKIINRDKEIRVQGKEKIAKHVLKLVVGKRYLLHLTGMKRVVAFDGKEQSGKMKIEIQNQLEKKRKPHAEVTSFACKAVSCFFLTHSPIFS